LGDPADLTEERVLIMSKTRQAELIKLPNQMIKLTPWSAEAHFACSSGDNFRIC
jgi:hypothetical protein